MDFKNSYQDWVIPDFELNFKNVISLWFQSFFSWKSIFIEVMLTIVMNN